MPRINESVEVEVPVRIAYDQWTQFEQFPYFMEGVDRVIQLDDKTLDWTATIAGKVKHWRAEIVRQEPDRVIAWRSVDGARNDGSVTFESLGPDRARVELALDVEPEGVVEAAGEVLGFVARRAKGDMERFKEFIETRGVETGAWRGRIPPAGGTPGGSGTPGVDRNATGSGSTGTATVAGVTTSPGRTTDGRPS